MSKLRHRRGGKRFFGLIRRRVNVPSPVRVGVTASAAILLAISLVAASDRSPIRVAVVRDDAMTPAIHSGDLVVARRNDPTVRIGDLIVLDNPTTLLSESSGSDPVRRVTEIDNTTVWARTDRSDVPDSTLATTVGDADRIFFTLGVLRPVSALLGEQLLWSAALLAIIAAAMARRERDETIEDVSDPHFAEHLRRLEDLAVSSVSIGDPGHGARAGDDSGTGNSLGSGEDAGPGRDPGTVAPGQVVAAPLLRVPALMPALLARSEDPLAGEVGTDGWLDSHEPFANPRSEPQPDAPDESEIYNSGEHDLSQFGRSVFGCTLLPAPRSAAPEPAQTSPDAIDPSTSPELETRLPKRALRPTTHLFQPVQIIPAVTPRAEVPAAPTNEEPRPTSSDVDPVAAPQEATRQRGEYAPEPALPGPEPRTRRAGPGGRAAVPLNRRPRPKRTSTSTRDTVGASAGST